MTAVIMVSGRGVSRLQPWEHSYTLIHKWSEMIISQLVIALSSVQLNASFIPEAKLITEAVI